MTAPLISAGQLTKLQAIMAGNFTTKATILRYTEGDDDAITFPPVGTVVGWLSSSPTPEGTLDSGSFVTANTFRFGCPIDSDIRPRDRLKIGDTTFTVTDTTNDETWPLELSVSLRLRE